MDIAIILIITAAVAIYIALPFFLKKGKSSEYLVASDNTPEDPLIEKLKSLNSQKELLYTAIKDIEFDYGLGKLSTEDFEELQSQYKLEAATVLKKIDTIQSESGTQDSDKDLELEISSYRKSTPAIENLENNLEEEISAFRSSNRPIQGNTYCSKCGAEHGFEDLFCSKCGEKLN